MSGHRKPLADERDPYARAARERAAARAVRAQRTERAGLATCPACAGATEPVDDPTLGCICDAERAAIAARVARLAHEQRNRSGDRSDRIVP